MVQDLADELEVPLHLVDIGGVDSSATGWKRSSARDGRGDVTGGGSRGRMGPGASSVGGGARVMSDTVEWKAWSTSKLRNEIKGKTDEVVVGCA